MATGSRARGAAVVHDRVRVTVAELPAARLEVDQLPGPRLVQQIHNLGGIGAVGRGQRRHVTLQSDHRRGEQEIDDGNGQIGQLLPRDIGGALIVSSNHPHGRHCPAFKVRSSCPLCNRCLVRQSPSLRW